MNKTGFRLVVATLILALSVATGAPLSALPTPSKSAAEQSLLQRTAELAKIEAVVARPEITAALAEHGFSDDLIQLRLAQLSPEEIHSLSGQLDQLHAAGSSVPTYIWILIGILLGVLIVTAF